MKVTQLFISLFLFCVNVLFAQKNDTPRKNHILKNWFFIQNDIPLEKSKNEFSNYKNIQIPHSWGWKEAQKGNKKYYRGIGWYFTTINLSYKPNKRYFLKFDAASSVANVFINGKNVGEHRGGFSAFSFEITKQLKSTNNWVAVKVSNAFAEDVAPLGGDFNVYGGIYRPVTLIETNPICINITDHGSPGVKWLTTHVSKSKAKVKLTTVLSNSTGQGLPFNHYPKEIGSTLQEGLLTLKAKIVDQQGNIAALNIKQINASPRLTIPFYQNLEVTKPHLWNGILDPYLYKAVVEVYQKGILIDKVTQNIGFRFYNIDPIKGFFLNGKKYPINGVSKHQDKKDKGWAITNADMQNDINLIREMGANALRCAHYQHSDVLMDLCDKAGILVWSEIPQVGSLRNSEAYIKTTQDQLKDMIRQGINHPSIFVWGMFNEVHVRKYDPHLQFIDLQNLAKGEDPTRPTIAATSHYASPQMNTTFDLLGWNRYPGWYDAISDTKNHNLWKKYSSTSKYGGICFSEYGAGANINHHEQNPEQPIPRGFWHPEEWQTIAHENTWSQFKSHDFIWGTFIWNMFDFCAAKRNEGGQKGINDKGLISFDRKIKKDAFFFYKANWNKKPMLHITSKRHKIRNQATTPIKIYSNLKKIELIVNGEQLGSKTPNNIKIALWDDIPLKKGENKIKAISKYKGKTYTDKTTWVYDPSAKSLKPKTQPFSKPIKGDGGFGQ